MAGQPGLASLPHHLLSVHHILYSHCWCHHQWGGGGRGGKGGGGRIRWVSSAANVEVGDVLDAVLAEKWLHLFSSLHLATREDLLHSGQDRTEENSMGREGAEGEGLLEDCRALWEFGIGRWEILDRWKPACSFRPNLVEDAEKRLWVCLVEKTWQGLQQSSCLVGGDHKVLWRLPIITAVVLPGFFWFECKEVWIEGLRSYLLDWWNFLDIVILSMYLASFVLRLLVYLKGQVFCLDIQPSTAECYYYTQARELVDSMLLGHYCWVEL